jgi:hypothetical protein
MYRNCEIAEVSNRRAKNGIFKTIVVFSILILFIIGYVVTEGIIIDTIPRIIAAIIITIVTLFFSQIVYVLTKIDQKTKIKNHIK